MRRRPVVAREVRAVGEVRPFHRRRSGGDPAGELRTVVRPDRVQHAHAWSVGAVYGRGAAPHDPMCHLDEGWRDCVQRVHAGGSYEGPAGRAGNGRFAAAAIASGLMTEPLIASFEDVWGDIAGLCEGLTPEQWALPTDCPGWSVQDNVAHMIGTERMLAGEQPSAPRGRGRRRAAHPQRHRQGQRTVDRELPRPLGRRGARRVPRGHRAPARRVARAHGRRMGPRGIHAGRSGSVPQVHGDPRLRLLVPRPGHPRGGRAARSAWRDRSPTSRSGASRRRACPTSSERRPARRPAAA